MALNAKFNIRNPTLRKESLPVHASDRFDWNSETNTFSCEVSDFKGEVFTGSCFSNSIVPGFGIRSVSTGKIVYFALHHQDESAGEVAGWWYHALYGQSYDNLKVLIIND